MSNRLLHLSIPAISGDYSLVEFQGEDYISHPFYFFLTVLSPNSHWQDKDLIGKEVSITLKNYGQDPQYFHGYIYGFSKGKQAVDGLQAYHLVVYPMMRFMQDCCGCRVYGPDKSMTIPEIIKDIFQQHGCYDFDLSRLQNTYKPVNYRVQYNESPLAFIHRLLEEAGIYYYFQHSENKHTVIFEDRGYLPLRYQQGLRYEVGTSTQAHLHQWTLQMKAGPVKFSEQRYDYKNPSHLLEKSIQSPDNNIPLLAKKLAQKSYNQLPADSTSADIEKRVLQEYANMNLQRIQATASGNYIGLQAGSVVELTEHPCPSDLGEYVIYAIYHHAVDYSERRTMGKDTAQHYQNRFKAYSTHYPFVPLGRYDETQWDVDNDLRARKSILLTDNRPKISITEMLNFTREKMPNVQLAKVVGPKGRSVHTDHYGRVKLKFPWDRHSPDDGSNSCWVRVRQPQVSQGTGVKFIPRIGEEVLVEFEEGDIEKPVVLGTIPNEENLPPFEPEKYPARSGYKTQSLGDPDTTHGHQLRFDDTAHQESIYLKSQRDMNLKIQGDSEQRIGGDSTTLVKSGDYSAIIDDQWRVHSDKEITLSVGTTEIIIRPEGVTLQGDQVEISGAGVGGGQVHLEPNITVSDVAKKLSQTGQVKSEKPNQDKDHIIIEDLIYDTGTKTFYALTKAQAQEFQLDCAELQLPITQLMQANAMAIPDNLTSEAHQSAIEKRDKKVQAAKEALNKKIKSLVTGLSQNPKNPTLITEIAHFGGNKWTYVRSDKIKNHWRKYRLDKDIKTKSIVTNGSVDMKKLKKQIAKSALLNLIEFKEDWSGSIGSWARSINSSGDLDKAIFGDPNNPKAHLLVTGEAQVLRYTAGLSASSEFNPIEGKMSFDAASSAELAIAEGKVKGTWSIPDKNGWDLCVYYPESKSKTKLIDFGRILLELEGSLFGFAGASVLGSINLDCDMHAKGNLSQLKLKGTNQIKKITQGKQSDDGVDIGVNAFAGAKLGCEVGASLQWQDPEDLPQDIKNQTQEERKKALSKLEWKPIAKILAEGDAAAGIGGEAGFKIKYNEGKFVVRAKAGLVCGVGLSGFVNVVVQAETIVELVSFIYHKIMEQNYSFIGFIADDAFKQISFMFIKYIYDDLETIESAFEKGISGLAKWWTDTIALPVSQNQQFLAKAKKIANGINNDTHNKLKLTLSEVKGQLLFILTNKKVFEEIHDEVVLEVSHGVGYAPTAVEMLENEQAELYADRIKPILQAIIKVLAYIQTKADFINVMQHMSLNGEVSTHSIKQNEGQLYQCLDNHGRYLLDQGAEIRKLIEEIKTKIVYLDEPDLFQPVACRKGVICYA